MSLPRLTNENLRKDLIQTNYCEISIREGAFFIAFWKGEERKIKSRENDMKIRRDFCIVFLYMQKGV